MLNWFRTRQTVLLPGVLSVFIGSLFTLFCQHCLAQMEQDVERMAVSQTNDHCSHDKGPEPASPPSGQPCMGVCDCGDEAMLIADKHSIAISANKLNPEFKVSAPAASTWVDMSPRQMPFLIGKPHKPERASYLPLERYCVLLN
jgi:hypothetical protein